MVRRECSTALNEPSSAAAARDEPVVVATQNSNPARATGASDQGPGRVDVVPAGRPDPETFLLKVADRSVVGPLVVVPVANDDVFGDQVDGWGRAVVAGRPTNPLTAL